VSPTLVPASKDGKSWLHRLSTLTAYKYVCLRVDISTMVMCDAIGITVYDRRTPELANAALHMKQDTNSIEKYTF
tara:strand:- start:51 stop:275 length:225 start_codon:yes stop_codon:yes gene_type:complete